MSHPVSQEEKLRIVHDGGAPLQDEKTPTAPSCDVCSGRKADSIQYCTDCDKCLCFEHLQVCIVLGLLPAIL